MLRPSMRTTWRPASSATTAYSWSSVVFPTPPAPVTCSATNAGSSDRSADRKIAISAWRPTKRRRRADASRSAIRARCAGAATNRRDEPVASLRNRLDVLRGPLVVAERAAQVGNRPGQGRLGDEPALPHGVDDLVLRDHAAPAAGQKGQEIHDLGLEMPQGLAVADEISGGLREPAAHAKVWSGGRTSLAAGHGPILDESAARRNGRWGAYHRILTSPLPVAHHSALSLLPYPFSLVAVACGCITIGEQVGSRPHVWLLAALSKRPHRTGVGVMDKRTWARAWAVVVAMLLAVVAMPRVVHVQGGPPTPPAGGRGRVVAAEAAVA